MNKISDTKLLALILSGESQTAISEQFNMTVAAVNRRVNNPDFQALLAEYRRDVLDSVLTSLTSKSQKAADVLISLLDDKNSFIKLQASKNLLALVQEFSLERDLLRQVEELKARTDFNETV